MQRRDVGNNVIEIRHSGGLDRWLVSKKTLDASHISIQVWGVVIGGLFPVFRHKNMGFPVFRRRFFNFPWLQNVIFRFPAKFYAFFRFSGTFLVLYRLSAKSISAPQVCTTSSFHRGKFYYFLKILVCGRCVNRWGCNNSNNFSSGKIWCRGWILRDCFGFSITSKRQGSSTDHASETACVCILALEKLWI